MVLTELGIDTLFKSVQLEKALLPITVTEFGIVTLVKVTQLEKAEWSIKVTEYVVPKYVTEAGITTSPEYSLAYSLYVLPL